MLHYQATVFSPGNSSSSSSNNNNNNKCHVSELREVAETQTMLPSGTPDNWREVK